MRTTTRGSAGHGGDRLPGSTSANMAGRGPSRYRSYGEGDDASAEPATPFVRGAVVPALILLACVAAGAAACAAFRS